MADFWTRRAFLAATAVTGVAGVAGCATSSNAGSSSASSTGYQPTNKWHIPSKQLAKASLIDAYAGSTSVLPGQPVSLYVSSAADSWTLDVYRIGNYAGLGGAKIASAGPFPGKQQGPPKQDSKTRAMSAPWTVSTQLDTAGWPEGLYLLRVNAKGLSRHVPLIVRSTSAVGKVAYVGAAATWQAYNIWGGRSLYGNEQVNFAERSYAVSFDRPYDDKGIGLLHAFEVPLARVADESAVPLAWFANTDIDQHPELLNGAIAVVSPGHDEYWSVPHRDAMTKARDAGANLTFFGANGSYWRVRASDTATGPGRLITCYKSAALDPVQGPSTTARWRDKPDPRPENEMIGQMYDAYPVQGPLTIRDPDFFLFAGTGVSQGSQLDGLLGPETDRYYPNADAQHPTQLPALSDVTCNGKKSWSTASYYTTPSGSGVFATGTMAWTRALPRPILIPGATHATVRFTHAVTLNTFAALASGPLGKSHPAKDDAGSASLPNHNTSGAAADSD